jgi:hypothetical protein
MVSGKVHRDVRLGALALAVCLAAVAALAAACGGAPGGGGVFTPEPTNDASTDAGAPSPPLTMGDSGVLPPSPEAGTILLVSPAGSTLTVTGIGAMPTTKFTAVLQGTTTPVAATWTVDSPLVGTIDANGVFTAGGQLGGVVTITAQTEDAHGATTLTVDLHVSEDPGDAGAGTISSLRDGGTADPAFAWLYPYDGTVFPRELAAPVLQWGGEPATFVRVHVKSSTLDYEAFYGASNPAQASFSAAAWTAITESAAPGDPLTIEATKVSASGVTGPVTETWTIAQGSLKGIVYYNTYDSPLNNGNGAVMRIQPGQDAQILLGGCHVCHSVSANGATLLSMGAYDDPEPDAGPPGNDPYFYKLGQSYDLTNDAGVMRAQPDPSFAFGALTPDGTKVLTCGAMAGNFPPNIPGLGQVGVVDGGSGDRPSRLMDPRDGGVLSAPGFDGVVTHALMPAFAPGGDAVVFNHYDEGAGHSLAVMNFDPASNTFSNLVDVVDVSDAGAPDAGGDGAAVDAGSSDGGDAEAGLPPYVPPYLGWPYFLPDSKTVVYNTVDYGDYATWNDYGGEPDHHGDLYVVDVPTKIVTPLDALNGFTGTTTYLPYGLAEAHLNYEPTVLPVAVGGYYWVVFTSRREYGNTITDSNPFENHPATRKKLWVAAIDINATPGIDPSHPAFYLSGQEALAGNMRGFWVLNPCVQNGTTCGSGDECCSGFCRQTTADGGPVLSCVPQPGGCAEEYEKCTTAANCCGAAQGYQCINGYCAQPSPK